MGIANMMGAQAKAIADAIAKAKAAASAPKTASAPKATTPAKTTSTPKAVSTQAKATVSPGINIVNQIIAGNAPPSTTVTYEPVAQPMGPPAPPGYTGEPSFTQYDNKMPVTEYQEYLSNKISESAIREQETKTEILNQSKDIDVSAAYVIKDTNILPLVNFNKGVTLPGGVVKNIIEKQAASYTEADYRNQLQSEINKVSGFAPETTVSSTVRGFEYDFPYAGAEHYKEYKDVLQKQDIGTKFATGVATALTPEDPLGLKTIFYGSTGQKEKVLQTKIEAMARVEGIKESGGIFTPSFAGYWLENPATQIGMTIVGGNLLGKGLGYSTGYLTQIGKVGAAKLINVGVGAGFAAFGAVQGYDIYKSVESKDYASAFAKGGMLGFELAGGYVGFKSGQASGFKSGAEKGFNKYLSNEYKAGNIDATIYNASRDVMSSGKFLSKEGFDFIQKPMEGFKDVQTVKNEPELRGYLWEKTSATKSELFGGTVGQKPGGTHDIDVFMKAKTKVYSEYASKTLTGKDVSNFADVKMPQRPGDIVTEFGGVKQKPSIVEVGDKEFSTQKGMEQFTRKWQSSLRPAHSGRLKDMPEAIRLSTKLFEGRKLTPEIETNLAKFEKGLTTLYDYGEKNPLISSSARSEAIYGPSLSEKWYDTKVKFWEKVSSKYALKDDITIFTKGYNPPSPSSNIFVSPVFGAGLSSSLSIRMPKGFSSISKSSSISTSNSFGYSPSISPKISISKSFSPSYSPSPPSISKSISVGYSPSTITSKSISKDISFGYSPSFSKSFSISPSIIKSFSPDYSPSPPSISKSFSIPPSYIPSPYKYLPSQYYPSPSPSPSTSFTPSPSISLKIPGQGGDSGFGFGNYGKRKRYRESKTIDPFKEFDKQMKEAMKIGF